MSIIKTENISIMDVRNVLDYNSLDLGTLCCCSKINPWSKNKPVTLSDDVVASVNNGKPLSSISNWQKGKNGLFGFNVPEAATYKDIKDKALNWSYTPLSTPPYLLEFFANYNSSANPFIRTLYRIGDEININSDTVSEYSFLMMISSPGQASTSIGLEDFFATKIGSSYLTAIFYRDDFGIHCISSSEKTIQDGGASVKVDISKFPFSEYSADLVNYKVYFCLSSIRFTQDSYNKTSTFYPIPWNSNSYYAVDFNINNKVSIVMTSSYVGRSVTPTSIFLPISNFIHRPTTGTAVSFYTNNPLYFKMEVWSDSGEYMMHDAYLSMSYGSYHDTLEEIQPEVYDSTFTKIDHLTLTSEKKTIYIGASYCMLLKNGVNTLAWGEIYKFTIISLKYKDTLVFSTPINLTNQQI